MINSKVFIDHRSFLGQKKNHKYKKYGSCGLIEKKARNSGALKLSIVYVQFELNFSKY